MQHFITCTAGEGRTVPIHGNTATAPGDQLLIVRAGDVVRLPYDGDVRRHLSTGDLLPCDKAGKLCSLELADCPEPLDATPVASPVATLLPGKGE